MSSHHFDAVRSSRDGYEDPPDYFTNEVDDADRRLHEGKRRSVTESDDSVALQRRLKDQTQLVQDLTCQVNRLEREVEQQNEQIDHIRDVEMKNEILEEKFKIQSETIKTQQVRVNDAIRDRELAQKQSLEDAEEIDRLKKEVSELSLKLQETLVALNNKTKECNHHVDAYETLESHAQQLRSANSVLSERVQILEDLVDKYEKEDIGAFFTRKGQADLNAAKANAAGATQTNDRDGTSISTTNETTSSYYISTPSDAAGGSSSPLQPGTTSLRQDRRTQGQPIPNNNSSVVTVPTPMYALDVSGTPIIPRPILASSLVGDRSPSSSMAVGGGRSVIGNIYGASQSSGPYCLSPRRGDSPRNRNGSISNVAASASRYPMPLTNMYPRHSNAAVSLAPIVNSSTDSAPPTDQILLGGVGMSRGLSSPNRDEFGSPTVPASRGGSAGKGYHPYGYLPPTVSSTPDQNQRRSMGKGQGAVAIEDTGSRPETPSHQQIPRRQSTPDPTHQHPDAANRLVGRGVFQTLREKRMVMQEEEERMRARVLEGLQERDRASERRSSSAVGTASVD